MVAKNKKILEENLAVMEKCLDCQFSKFKSNTNVFQYKYDLFNDLYLELLNYDKLESVASNGHFNAFYTRCLVSNLYSKTSWFYRRYIKKSDTDDIQTLIKEEDGFGED